MVVKRRVALVALIVLLGLIALITFWPTPVDAPVQNTLIRVLAALHDRGLPSSIDYTLTEFMSNVLMFLPLGLLLTLVLRAGYRWTAPFLAAAASICVELGQLWFRPERISDPSDVVANTLGALIGTAIAAALLARTRPRARRRVPAHRVSAEVTTFSTRH
ncbi:hypothetical protein GCM10027416_07800 [Okibacterium endophyticum]